MNDVLGQGQNAWSFMGMDFNKCNTEARWTIQDRHKKNSVNQNIKEEEFLNEK